MNTVSRIRAYRNGYFICSRLRSGKAELHFFACRGNKFYIMSLGEIFGIYSIFRLNGGACNFSYISADICINRQIGYSGSFGNRGKLDIISSYAVIDKLLIIWNNANVAESKLTVEYAGKVLVIRIINRTFICKLFI